MVPCIYGTSKLTVVGVELRMRAFVWERDLEEEFKGVLFIYLTFCDEVECLFAHSS